MWTTELTSPPLQLKSIHYFPEDISSIQLKGKKNVNRKPEGDKVWVIRVYWSLCVFQGLHDRSNKIKVIKVKVYRCDHM